MRVVVLVGAGPDAGWSGRSAPGLLMGMAMRLRGIIAAYKNHEAVMHAALDHGQHDA